ncbi:4-phosphoerythronate dehydrogenase [Celerinatantimonas yamalensis]|uniref:Erythronate-4-phosphate dehydrogenase n=1 Tax=Celerinatantimonas yamalensis TaxID=559956 RepID=A0ABW9G2K2_9GAMM
MLQPFTLLVDENMPFAPELLSPFGQVITKSGRELCADDLINIDALMVRSVTKVDETLLAKANRLQFVGTATIGTDHIHKELLAARGIGFASAPGCNRIAVGEYVITSLLACAQYRGEQLAGKRLAVVGSGNTGNAVAQRAEAVGMKVLRYDPPLAAKGQSHWTFCQFEDVLNADVISLHVPLTRDGEHATYHLFDAEVLNQLRPEQILINACRGEVVDNQALLRCVQAKLAPALIWDVWEAEPNVLTDLVPYPFITTPHIAGYSLDGKMRGTQMITQALCQHLNFLYVDHSQQFLPAPTLSSIELTAPIEQATLGQLTQLIYNVFADDRRFRRDGLTAIGFDRLRKTYPQRREFATLSIRGVSDPRLAALGFALDPA